MDLSGNSGIGSTNHAEQFNSLDIVKDILLNIYAKFCFNPSNSFRREDFQSWKCKIQEKNPLQEL